MHTGLDEANALAIPCPVVIFFIILAVRTDIHIKNSAIQVAAGMFFGDHGILDGNHAADRRTITVAAPVGVPGTDTLEPGDFFRFLFIRRSRQVPHGRPGGTQDALEFQTGHHVGVAAVMIKFFQA